MITRNASIDKVVQALVNELPGVKWSQEFKRNYVPNNPSNLDRIYKQLKGVAWVNPNYFFPKSNFGRDNEAGDVQQYP